MMIEKEELQKLLHENIVSVTFTKINGDKRVMPCTLQADMIPYESKAKESGRVVNPDVCSVWATDANGWRAFRWDSVECFNV
jgi:hypothetical protein